MPLFDVKILVTGNCFEVSDGNYTLCCNCTLILGKYNVIVNTLSRWDINLIKRGLKRYELEPSDIDYVISTHERPDYSGNNYLFTDSIHIVGHNISKNSEYLKSPLSLGNEYCIEKDCLKIIPTPGYTLTDTTVMVKTKHGMMYITGELFQSQGSLIYGEESLKDEFLCRRKIQYPITWRYFRNMVISKADFIIPGHGHPMKIKKGNREAFLAIDNRVKKQDLDSYLKKLKY